MKPAPQRKPAASWQTAEPPGGSESLPPHPSPIDDIDQAISYLASQAGWNIALKVEQELFDVFEKLASFPGLGHRRSDLTSLPLHFFPSEPYLIAYQRDIKPFIIHSVLHGARDVADILSERP